MSNGDEQPRKRTIDERIDALTMNVELISHDVESLRASMAELRVSTSELRVSTSELAAASKQDGENIRALARIAEIHERRLSAIEGHAKPAA
jgi:prefoldin subunit 5